MPHTPTAASKEHFEVLDGLRGSAAIAVVLFHIQGITVAWEGAKVILHHAPLAVDFFFALSGFVIGYAYDDRRDALTTRAFLGLRLVRLHPLVVLGVVMGFASYLLDPFAGAAQNATIQSVLIALALGLTLLPSPTLPNRWTDTHPLNGPCWSLLQEYIGNVAYAVVLRHLSARALGLIALLSGAGLVASGLALGTLDHGHSYGHLWMAPLRLTFSFVAGLWLFRVRDRLPPVRLGWLALTIIMTAIMAFPTLPNVGGIELNGLYEALCVILAFPFIVIAGSHAKTDRLARICKAAGRLSYPLYITHFPLMYVWMNYVANQSPTQGELVGVGLVLLLTVLAIAWAADALWDTPIRRRLRPRLAQSSS